MLTKDNVNIGTEWRFGHDWLGQRCGAKTRRGIACQRPANKKNGRCRLHGGASTGAKTEEGRARISAANLRYGKFTKDKLEKRKANAAKGREIRKELRQMEREPTSTGETASRHRCHSRQPIMGSLHRLRQRNTATLILPVPPMTPAAIEAPRLLPI